MPRDGSGVMSKPAGTTAAPNTKIESAKFNSVVDDLVTDANTARPIVAGGTGATTAAGARTNLGVDVAQAYTVKTGNYTALLADNNAVHNFTGATPTLSLTAAATLGANWHYDGLASGGPVIIDPNGAELINGSATLTVPQYSNFSIKCDGTGFICIIDITASGGTFTGAVTFGSTATLSADPSTALQAATKQYTDNKGTLYGFRNKIIDPNFDFWTATSSTANGYVTSTMSQDNHVGATKTASQQLHTLGQTAVPGEPTYFHRTVVSGAGSAAGDFCNKTFPIESVRTLAGKTATVTLWGKSDAARNIAIDLAQIFGTGGSPSANVVGIGARQVALTTGFQKISFNVNIPSIAGKTLGTNNNDFLGLVLWYSAGTSFAARTASLPLQTGTFDISRISIVEGDATGEADPTSVRHPPIEQYLVTDMFETIEGILKLTNLTFVYPFKTRKRRAPVLTLFPDSGSGGTIGLLSRWVGCYQTVNHSGDVGFYATVDQRL